VFVPVDVRLDDDLQAMIAAAVERFGALDVLVNNAGGGGHIPPHFPDASPAVWGATLDLNLRSAMRATQLALEQMRRAGGGAIVNIASTAGLGADRYQSPEYAAAKAGLIRFTTALGAVQPGIRVNCVVPDWIATERATEELATMNPAERAAAPVPIPMDVVADAVVELIRDDAATGRIVVLRSAAANPG
jgi:NAD(P)-dependent dehydrogenase (short-subunit alcohol dehydrogenase family)